MPTPSPSGSASSTGKSDSFSGLFTDSDEKTAGDRAALPIAPNFKFFYLHWPSEWSVQSDGFEGSEAWWLPTLAKHVVRPGINMNRTLKRDEPATAAYDRQMMKNRQEGAEYLELSDWRTKVDGGGSYRREAFARDPRTKRAGKHFSEAFATPRDKLPNRRLKFDFDRGAYNRWLLKLVQLGVIVPPSRSVIREHLRMRGERLDRARSFTGLEDSEKKRRTKEAQKLLTLWQGAKVPELDPDLFTTGAKAQA